MALEESEIRALIDKVDAEIQALLTGDGAGLVNYSVGDRRVEKSSRLGELRALRRQLLDQLARLGAQEVSLFDDPAL